MNKYLQIKTYTKKDCNYFYAERLGKDSIAFILRDFNTGRVGLIKEFKPPIDQFLTTAFGGSLDKDIPLEAIVREEVAEEAGYVDVCVTHLGKSFVSTQMNQFCHLYIVDVTHATKQEPNPQSELEKIASVKWVYPSEVVNGECWKAITILTKAGIV